MSELKPGEKRAKRKILWDKVSFILIAVFLTLSTLFSITLIYQKVYYNIKWVNGQSMYPTFNLNAVDQNGNKKGKEGGRANSGDKNLDCVIWDGHKVTLEKLERFDIVIVAQPNNTSKDLIKRLIAMPGETFYFGSGEDNGSLYIADVNGNFNLVSQPIGDDYIKAGTYDGYHEPYTLGKDEYFVCGDNRGYSSDSRSFGPIKTENLLGLVVAVVGSCDATLDEEDKVTYTNLKVGWPRYIK